MIGFRRISLGLLIIGRFERNLRPITDLQVFFETVVVEFGRFLIATQP